MSSKQIFFFATWNDIEPILHDFESKFSVQYFELGMFDSTDDIVQFSSIFDIPLKGKAKGGDWNDDQRLLIIKSKDFLKTRDIPQRKGGIKYTFDMAINLESIYLQLGGIWEENILIAGKTAIVHDNDFSIQSYNHLSSKIKRDFKRIGSFYVGKEAEEKLQSGWRLVTHADQGKEYDLQYE